MKSAALEQRLIQAGADVIEKRLNRIEKRCFAPFKLLRIRFMLRKLRILMHG